MVYILLSTIDVFSYAIRSRKLSGGGGGGGRGVTLYTLYNWLLAVHFIEMIELQLWGGGHYIYTQYNCVLAVHFVGTKCVCVFAGAQTVVSLLQTTQIKQGVSFIAANKVYTSTNKTTIV